MGDLLGGLGNFVKGVGEGAWDGAKGMVEGVGALAKGGYNLATSADARQQAWDTAVKDANAVGQFAETAVTDPGKAAAQVGDAVSSTWGKVSTAYQQAAADGHGAEFIGKAFGQGAVLVGTAFIPGGAEAEAVGALGDAGRVAEVAGDLGKAGAVAGDAGKAEIVSESAAATRSTNLPLKVSEPGAQPPPPLGPKGAPIAQPEPYPKGLAYRVDLPDHLSGPDGFKGGKLNGTHNEQNAISELQGRGAT